MELILNNACTIEIKEKRKENIKIGKKDNMYHHSQVSPAPTAKLRLEWVYGYRLGSFLIPLY